MSRSDQNKLAKVAGGSIRFMPAYAHMTGSTKTGLMLSQLVYWHGMGKRFDGYFYKSVREFENETGLTRHEQEKAVRQLKLLQLIETRRAGIPATRVFWVNISKVEELLTKWKETAEPDVLKAIIQLTEKRRTNTETTQDITPETFIEYDLTHPSFRQAEPEGPGIDNQENRL